MEVYQAADVARELGLSRDDLVRLALLLGSDYTEGVRGIGPVNACEVLRAFPGDEGLVAFREWLHSVQPEPELSRAELADADPAAAFKAAHRTGRRTWQVSDSFPNAAVLASYRRPAVRELPEAGLSWALPDLEGLRLLCQERFAWPRDRADAELLPMMRELTSGAVQASIAPYLRTYADGDRAARIRSVRLRTAVEGITGCSAADIALPPDAPLQAPAAAAAAPSGSAAAAKASAPRQVSRKTVRASAAGSSAGGREATIEASGSGKVRPELSSTSASAGRLSARRATARKRKRVLRSLSSSSSHSGPASDDSDASGASLG